MEYRPFGSTGIDISPLCLGTDNFNNPTSGKESIQIIDAAIEAGNRFVKMAGDYTLSPAQLALLWVKDQPGITAPIIGPRTLEQLKHLLPVLEMNLPDDLRKACDQLSPPGSSVANFHNTAGW